MGLRPGLSHIRPSRRRTSDLGAPIQLASASRWYKISNAYQPTRSHRGQPLEAPHLERKRLLDGNPTLAATKREQKGWSNKIAVGDASIRVFFPPEPDDERASIDAIVDAVNAAEHSVLLCVFDPTDKKLLDAVFAAADN